MNRTILKSLLVVVATMFVTERAFAWANVGHAVIAHKAEELLKPEVREKCYHYLHASLAFHASWMDQYRSIEGYTECDLWHSTNIDAKYKVVVGKKTTGAYHIERIRKEMAGGAYKTMPDSLVKINLQYLIHMIGDHHCPVHVRWSSKEHPAFKYNLKRKGKKYGYHSFWDGSPGYKRKGWTCERYSEVMGVLPKGKAKKVQKGSGYDWTQETADVSRYCFTVIPKDTEVTKLSKETVETVHQIVDKQMLYAAYRLAGVLNDIFEDKEYKTGKK